MLTGSLSRSLESGRIYIDAIVGEVGCSLRWFSDLSCLDKFKYIIIGVRGLNFLGLGVFGILDLGKVCLCTLEPL